MRRFLTPATLLYLALGAVPVSAQDAAAEIAFVKSLFAELQPKSFRSNREYCGYIGYDRRGRLVATRARRGGADHCEPRWPWRFDPVASFHTHAAYDPEAWSEIPSGSDMESDEAEGVDGYVATPGGRLWYIDSTDMIASQICGVGCLSQDPAFLPETDIVILQSYSYDALIDVFEEDGH
ncbi:DUF4329 domain-containing protein [Tropicimonas sp. S265A]|uniref:DUF4329 domain-containing protein n=1 Tax=Tropicimonas sp. S265A TaxID=3415134 RepID=UPI003C7EBD45